MTANLLDLITTETADELLSFMLTRLGEKGWPTTDWEPGALALSLLEIDTDVLADVLASVQLIAKGGHLDLSESDWLTLLARSQFQVERKAPVFALANVRLTCSAAAGPYTIGPGGSTIITADGRRYTSTNTTNQNLASGGTLDLTYRAESPGNAWNLSLATTLTLVTTLAGVTAAPRETFTGSGSAMVTPGVNEESDRALRARCKAKWALLGAEKTHDAYFFLATSALDPSGNAILGITKALVDDTNPDGPGTIRIYLGGDDGGATDAPTIANVNTYLQARKGLCASLATQGATNDTVTITATVYCMASQVAAAKVAILAALAQYQADLDIGDGAGAGKVLRAQVAEFLMAPEGVDDAPLEQILLNGSEADYTPAKGHQVVFDVTVDGGSPTITFVEV
jgi:uncharacterized phage protein gp47/JayE